MFLPAANVPRHQPSTSGSRTGASVKKAKAMPTKWPRKGKGVKGKEKGRESERGSDEAESNLIRVIAQLLLRHEDATSILRADKACCSS